MAHAERTFLYQGRTTETEGHRLQCPHCFEPQEVADDFLRPRVGDVMGCAACGLPSYLPPPTPTAEESAST